MVLRLLTLVSLLFLLQASLSQPWPYPLKPGPGEFWFGTEGLWTVLPEGGAWRGLPHYTPNDPTFRQKLLYWRKGYIVRTEAQPKFTVTGRRLDAPAPPMLVDHTTTNRSFSQVVR